MVSVGTHLGCASPASTKMDKWTALTDLTGSSVLETETHHHLIALHGTRAGQMKMLRIKKMLVVTQHAGHATRWWVLSLQMRASDSHTQYFSLK